jgi:MFS family permease
MKNWRSKLIIINKEFTFFVITRILFIAGLRMTPVLLGYYLYSVTNSKLALGFLGLSEVIPAVLLSLPAGVRVDKSNKHRLITFSILTYLLLMVGLLFVTSGWMRQRLSILNSQLLIFSLIALTGIARAYAGPAFNAFLAQLVPTDKLVKAVSFNSMVWLIAAVVGPALAGVLMGYATITFSFVIICTFLLASILFFLQIKPKPVSWHGNSKTLESMLEGLHFVFQNKALLGALSLDMFAVLFGGVTAILPVFAKDILHVGAQGLGLLTSATFVGNFLAIAWLTSHPLKGKQGTTLLYCVGGFGLCILLFALSGNYWLSISLLFLSGIFDGFSVIIRGTIVQLFVPDEMRGRVSSVNSIFISSSNELGQFESGLAASAMGTIPSVIFGGCMTLAVVIVTWLKAPTLQKFEY